MAVQDLAQSLDEVGRSALGHHDGGDVPVVVCDGDLHHPGAPIRLGHREVVVSEHDGPRVLGVDELAHWLFLSLILVQTMQMHSDWNATAA
ncbi:hypothetical protein CMI47_06565 [Candidatus Pacearchaeota archaeon]|nr:hypothetical protein [Candidatus Pacearchaeota archaeon]